jgi:RNA polymerase sigma-70 factor, ECF subfamily
MPSLGAEDSKVPGAEDTELLSASEEAQFWEFHSKTADALFRKAYRMCRGHEADAKDAVQQTYLQVLLHWRTVCGLAEAKRQAWLATTLAREVMQLWRRPYRSREIGSQEDARERPAEAGGAEAADGKEGLERVCRAIARLEGRQREVMALHCLAGYELPEVAEMLGISQATVRVHLHVARMRLREIIEREDAGS